MSLWTALLIIEAISFLIIAALAWGAPEGFQTDAGFFYGTEE